MCYLRMHQDNALIHAARMARADTVIVCSLPLAKNAMHSPTSNYTYIRLWVSHVLNITPYVREYHKDVSTFEPSV